MRIVKINHFRCNEPEKSRFYVVDPAFVGTHEEVLARVKEAQRLYLEAYDKYSKEAKPVSPEMDLMKLDRFSTVDDCQQRVVKYRAAMEAWEKGRNEASRTFDGTLAACGIVPLDGLVDLDSVELDWGHRHGQKLEF